MEILWICLGACGIALVVFLLKKFVPGLSNNSEKEKDEKEENNIDKYVVPFEETTQTKEIEEDDKK
ncbi:MAG: hypothetical protein ACI4U5_01565 [Bacilli bacterium]